MQSVRRVWADTDPLGTGDNRFRMSRVVKKGSRIDNWRMRRSVLSDVHLSAHYFLFIVHIDLLESTVWIHWMIFTLGLTRCYCAQRQTQLMEFDNTVTFPGR
ncbi:hypothetical protein TNCV_2132101 [Trichonephila clavipes]|nr:hypothetical protein TNCV_2132101 [Trichonephila clavipes]